MKKIKCVICHLQCLKINHNMKKAFFNNEYVCSANCHIEYEQLCRSYPDKAILNSKLKNEIWEYWQ